MTTHSSGACIHILVHRCDINYKKFYFLSKIFKKCLPVVSRILKVDNLLLI